LGLSNSLQGLRIGGTFRRFLQVPPEGVDGTLRDVCDGEGDVLPFRLSTSAAQFTGPLTTAAVTVAGGVGSTINNTAIGTVTPNTAAFTRLRSDPAGARVSQNVAGATSGVNTQWMRHHTRWFGTLAARDTTFAYSAANVIGIDDAFSCPKTVAGIQSALHVNYVVQGAVTTGEEAVRYASTARMAVASQLGGEGYIAFVPLAGEAFATVSQGGAGGWTGSGNPENSFRGSIFGGFSNVRIGTSATNFRDIFGHEINLSIRDDATVFAGVGLAIVEKSGNKQAIEDHAAIAVLSDPDAPGWKVGIAFGCSWGQFPLSADATLIKYEPKRFGSAAVTPNCGRGIDFRGVVFSAPAIETAGFALSSTGGVTFTPPTSATLATNGEVTFVRVSNTQLRIDMRGTDGVTRSNTLTLT
jgi:hypothetical protein